MVKIASSAILIFIWRAFFSLFMYTLSLMFYTAAKSSAKLFPSLYRGEQESVNCTLYLLSYFIYAVKIIVAILK